MPYFKDPNRHPKFDSLTAQAMWEYTHGGFQSDVNAEPSETEDRMIICEGAEALARSRIIFRRLISKLS